jgi:hypothetical protein
MFATSDGHRTFRGAATAPPPRASARELLCQERSDALDIRNVAGAANCSWNTAWDWQVL